MATTAPPRGVPFWISLIACCLALGFFGLWLFGPAGDGSKAGEGSKDGKDEKDDPDPKPNKPLQVVVGEDGELELIHMLPRFRHSFVDADGYRRGVVRIENVGPSDAAFRPFGLAECLVLRRRGGNDQEFSGGDPRATIGEFINGKIKPIKEQVDRVETKVGQLESKIGVIDENICEILERLPPSAPAPATGQ